MNYFTKIDNLKLPVLLTALQRKTDYKWVEGQDPLDYTPLSEAKYLFIDTDGRRLQVGSELVRSYYGSKAEEVPFARLLDIAVRGLGKEKDIITELFGEKGEETKILWRSLEDNTTVVLVENDRGKAVGVSRCNPRDVFSASMGFTIAYERAVQKLDGERVGLAELKACLYAGFKTEHIFRLFGWDWDYENH